jgi:predicted dehydrogenase
MVGQRIGSSELRLGLVGAGYFGGRHAAALAGLPGVRLVAVADADGVRAEALARAHGAEALARPDELARRVDAAVVATPASTHFEIARALLSAGVHLLVEKPLAATGAEAEALCALAVERGRVLRVGHLERFNPAFEAFRARLQEPRWLRLERLGPDPGRGLDVDVIREVMIHDLDLLTALGLGAPELRSVQGGPGSGPGLHVVAVRLRWPSGLEAELLASRAHAQARRGILALDGRGVLEVDLAARRVRRTGPRAPEEFACERADALSAELEAFLGAILGRLEPRGADGPAGLAAVRLAERLLEALDRPGARQ